MFSTDKNRIIIVDGSAIKLNCNGIGGFVIFKFRGDVQAEAKALVDSIAVRSTDCHTADNSHSCGII